MNQRRMAWMLLATFVSALAVSVAGVVYTGVSTENNNRQWCELLIPLDDAYSSAPPQTELGEKVTRAVSKIRDNFKC